MLSRTVLEAPAVALAWTLGIIGAFFLAIGCVLVSIAAWVKPLRDRNGERFDFEDLEA